MVGVNIINVLPIHVLNSSSWFKVFGCACYPGLGPCDENKFDFKCS